MMHNINALKVINLHKSFKERAVVNGIDLIINRGECVGLLGPNGAGKTTCFYMIVGSQACDAGQILFGMTDVTKEPMHKRARRGIGYLPQEASIFRKLNVADNILAILQLRKDLTPVEQLNKLEFLMEEFHITHLRTSLGLSLSGGERRRVEIARALAMEPLFMLLDEPFAGVDPLSVLEIKKIIQQLCKKNIGVLITDHNVRETLDICDRAYIVNKGQVLCEGNAQMILDNKEVRAVYLGEEFYL